ncbi:MAG: hypothetical protein LBI64_04310 [Coriobacteriales bacterium]|jgi:two-component system phosphate regulon sensor histidine kinase PhoR|nr:hypothetical protein [Coriobacteriales bacterium]
MDAAQSQSPTRSRDDDAAAKSRREFTANVSHELKTPLTVILGYAELMKDGIAREEDFRRFSKLIYREAKHMMGMVEDILVISELDENENRKPYHQAEGAQVELVGLTRVIVERLTPYAEQNQIRLELTNKVDEVFVRGPERILTEMVYNLCENAIRYNKPRGRVWVLLDCNEDGEARLEVRDTGIGIAQRHQEKIFERFYCVDKSRSRETGGTGLGLAIVKHGAQYLDARLQVKSELDLGTSITLEFPEPPNRER